MIAFVLNALSVGLLIVIGVLVVRAGRELKFMAVALKELHDGLAMIGRGVGALREQIPSLEAMVSNARVDVRHVADEQVALMKANDEFGKFLDHAIEELRDEQKRRETVPDDAWKAGEVAMSRMARTRQVYADLEAESLKESLEMAAKSRA